MNEEVKKAFRPKPMISYRSSRKISSYLIRAKLYPTNTRLVVTNVVANVVKYVDIFQKLIPLLALSQGKSFMTNLTCTKCRKQYTGQNADNVTLVEQLQV